MIPMAQVLREVDDFSGDFPGDGKAKPIAPQEIAEYDPEGLPFLNLKTLLELKTASGMTAAHRMQDLADVMNLIRVNNLSVDYASNLHPFVREKFLELWQLAQIQDD